MDYTLNQLRVFLKVAEVQSVTKAAEELHLTQPAVSIQLKKFQDQFEIPITEVVGRQLYVTDFGKEIVLAGKRILEEVEAIRYKTLAYKGQLVGRLQVSVVSTGKYVMPFFLADFVKQHPGVDLVMDVTNKTQVVRSLEQNEVDFALVSVLPGHLQVERVALMPNKLYLMGNAAYREADNPGLSLGNLPLIFREKGSATRQAMEAYLAERQIKVGKKMELTSNEAVKQAVIAGLGVSIMPVIGLRNELERGELEILPAKELPRQTTWNLVWLKSKRLSPLAEAYLKYLEEEKKQITKTHFAWFANY